MDQITQLVLQNKNLIYKIAHYLDHGSNIEDLFQVGCIGLMNAYDNFDETRGVKFTSYAYMYIMGEMKAFLRKNRNIKVSKEMMKLSLQIERTRAALAQKMYRQPTLDELAAFLEQPKELIVDALTNFESVSLDRENEVGNLYDVVPGNVIDYSDFIMMKDEIDKLPEPDRTIIIKRYLHDHTQSEVAKSLGTNQAFVSRTENKALKLLRSNAA